MSALSLFLPVTLAVAPHEAVDSFLDPPPGLERPNDHLVQSLCPSGLSSEVSPPVADTRPCPSGWTIRVFMETVCVLEVC